MEDAWVLELGLCLTPSPDPQKLYSIQSVAGTNEELVRTPLDGKGLDTVFLFILHSRYFASLDYSLKVFPVCFGFDWFTRICNIWQAVIQPLSKYLGAVPWQFDTSEVSASNIYVKYVLYDII